MDEQFISDFLEEVAQRNEVIVSSSRPRADPREEFGPEESTSRERRVVSPRRYVLVVEDDADVRASIVGILRDAGYQVLDAVNGVEALRILEREYYTAQYATGQPRMPSVILLDIMLPVMSGPEFYVELRRSHPMFDEVQVIVMSADPHITAFQSWAVNTEGLDAPASTLTKPFAGGEEILRKVRLATGGP